MTETLKKQTPKTSPSNELMNKMQAAFQQTKEKIFKEVNQEAAEKWEQGSNDKKEKNAFLTKDISSSILQITAISLMFFLKLNLAYGFTISVAALTVMAANISLLYFAHSKQWKNLYAPIKYITMPFHLLADLAHKVIPAVLNDSLSGLLTGTLFFMASQLFIPSLILRAALTTIITGTSIFNKGNKIIGNIADISLTYILLCIFAPSYLSGIYVFALQVAMVPLAYTLFSKTKASILKDGISSIDKLLGTNLSGKKTCDTAKQDSMVAKDFIDTIDNLFCPIKITSSLLNKFEPIVNNFVINISDKFNSHKLSLNSDDAIKPLHPASLNSLNKTASSKKHAYQQAKQQAPQAPQAPRPTR